MFSKAQPSKSIVFCVFAKAQPSKVWYYGVFECARQRINFEGKIRMSELSLGIAEAAWYSLCFRRLRRAKHGIYYVGEGSVEQSMVFDMFSKAEPTYFRMFNLSF